MDGASRSTPLPYRVSLVIPAFNEEQSIGQAVIEAEEALAVVAEDYEILVVDDGSSDETANEVARLGVDRPRLRLLRHDGNRGYGEHCAPASKPPGSRLSHSPTPIVSSI